MIDVLFGFFDYAERRIMDKPFYHMTKRNLPRMPTTSSQFVDWAEDLWGWANLLPCRKSHYNPHFWTISTEDMN